MHVVRFSRNKKHVKKFLSFPDTLYLPLERTQNKAVEKELLLGNHILSSNFQTIGFLVLNDNAEVLARCMATLYPNDNCIYFGFFECVQSLTAARLLLDAVRALGIQMHKFAITGPVDASFWIGYRLKLNNFGKPYTCEPYNKNYYTSLFNGAGLNISEQYCSNCFCAIEKSHSNPKLERRLSRAENMGYEIVAPQKKISRQRLYIYTS